MFACDLLSLPSTCLPLSCTLPRPFTDTITAAVGNSVCYCCCCWELGLLFTFRFFVFATIKTKTANAKAELAVNVNKVTWLGVGGSLDDKATNASSSLRSELRISLNWPNKLLHHCEALLCLENSHICTGDQFDSMKIGWTTQMKSTQTPTSTAQKQNPASTDACIVFVALLAAFHIKSKSLAENSH